MTIMRPYFSIVIPAKNEERLLMQCLDSVTSQTTDKPYEIIVVDGNSTDRTKNIAGRFPVTLLTQKQPGKVHGIQTGLLHARGRIVCLTEADCIVPPGWLAAIDRLFASNPEAIAVTGFYTFHDATLAERLLIKLFWWLSIYPYTLVYGNHTLRASNSAIQKDILTKHGFLDTQFAELYDLDLALRLKNAGPIRFDRSMNIQTSSRRIKGRLRRFIPELFKSLYHVAVLRRPQAQELYEHIR